MTAIAVVEPSPMVAVYLAELNPPEPLPLSIELPEVAAAYVLAVSEAEAAATFPF